MRSKLVVLVMLVGCGGSDPNPGGTPDGSGPGPDGSGPAPDAPDSSNRFEPWHVGAVWTYSLTDPTGTLAPRPAAKTTIEAFEDVGGTHAGTFAFRLRAEQLDGSVVAYQGYEGDLSVRYAQTDFDLNNQMVDVQSEAPFRLKLDEGAAHIVAGATYSETFDETTTNNTGTATNTKVENWRVINPAESVVVQAGTFTALHVRRVNANNATKTKDYWFVRGMGKVKEIGGGQDEELVSYTP